jgi:hypothetical protein
VRDANRKLVSVAAAIRPKPFLYALELMIHRRSGPAENRKS